MSGTDAIEFMMAGAQAVQVGVAMVDQQPFHVLLVK